MKRLKSLVLTALAAVMAVALVPSLPVAADSAALSIVPKKNYTVEPGKSIKDTLVIRNLDAKETLNLSLRVVDFTYNDDGGTPKLMLAEDAPQTTWSLKPFITLPKTVSIKPMESTTVEMGVSIPANHGAGSYYSAIVYSSGAADGSGNVGLSASGVTLAFVNIPGEVKEDLTLEKFGAYHQTQGSRKAGYTFVTAEKPETIAYTLKNNGNVTESPVGSITIKPWFGATKTISDVNPNQSLALIGQTRTFTSCIQLKEEKVPFGEGSTRSTACTSPNLWPGFYKLDLNLFYGQNGNRTQDIVSSSWFIYLPVWFIIILLLLIAGIGFYGYRTYNKVRGAAGKKKKKQRK